MTLLLMNETVSADLLHFPRGDRAQNIFRSVFQQVRMNGLGRTRELPPTFGAALDLAHRLVRQSDPALAEFVPIAV
jgi:hypothetical protein